MLRPRLIAALVLAFLVVVLIVQNTTVVTLEMLFWKFKASLVILVTSTAIVGFVCGYLVARTGKSR